MSELLHDSSELERRRGALIRELRDSEAEGRCLASGTLDAYIAKGLPVWVRAIVNTYATQNGIEKSQALAEMIGYYARFVGVPQDNGETDAKPQESE